FASFVVRVQSSSAGLLLKLLQLAFDSGYFITGLGENHSVIFAVNFVLKDVVSRLEHCVSDSQRRRKRHRSLFADVNHAFHVLRALHHLMVVLGHQRDDESRQKQSEQRSLCQQIVYGLHDFSPLLYYFQRILFTRIQLDRELVSITLLSVWPFRGWPETQKPDP